MYTLASVGVIVFAVIALVFVVLAGHSLIHALLDFPRHLKRWYDTVCNWAFCLSAIPFFEGIAKGNIDLIFWCGIVQAVSFMVIAIRWKKVYVSPRRAGFFFRNYVMVVIAYIAMYSSNLYCQSYEFEKADMYIVLSLTDDSVTRQKNDDTVPLRHEGTENYCINLKDDTMVRTCHSYLRDTIYVFDGKVLDKRLKPNN